MTNQPKLSKTETQLLNEARSNRHALVTVHSGFYTGARKGSYGTRRINALLSLAKRGLLKFYSQTHGTHHFIGNWSTDHYTETTFKMASE